MAEFPDMLYKMRRGIAPYRHIDGNVYEDCTCRHGGDNCRISVKQVDDHWEFDSCVNKAAKEWVFYHERYDYDTHYYASKKEALRAWYHNRIDAHYRWIEDFRKEYDEKKAELDRMSLKEARPQTIEKLSFGDKVLIVDKSCENKIGGVFGEGVIEYKVYSKDGLSHLLTADEEKICDTEHKTFMEATTWHTDYDGDYVSDDYAAFLSREDYETYLHNEKYQKLEEDVKNLPRSICRVGEDIEKLKAEMEEKTANENG